MWEEHGSQVNEEKSALQLTFLGPGLKTVWLTMPCRGRQRRGQHLRGQVQR